jgi:hypothetical protein
MKNIVLFAAGIAISYAGKCPFGYGNEESSEDVSFKRVL